MNTQDDGSISVKVRNPNGGYRTITLNMFNIDEADLTREFSQQASLYAYFATATALADREAASARAQVEQSYAQNDLEWRQSFSASGMKITEGQIKASVEADPEYVKKVEQQLAADYDLKVLRAITDALKMRADMLISLGAHLRAELDQTGMNIKEREFQSSIDGARQRIAEARKKNS